MHIYPSEKLREEAKLYPDGWVFEMDGDSDPTGFVPPEKIQGAWKVGPDGKLTGEYRPNSQHPTWRDIKHVEVMHIPL